MVKLAFPEELRLLTPSHFHFRLPAATTGWHAANHHPRPPEFAGASRIGLTVAKKNVKRAHERNRIKRLTRESFRLRQHELPPMDFVVVAKRGLPTSITVLSRKRWKNYGAAIVAGSRV